MTLHGKSEGNAFRGIKGCVAKRERLGFESLSQRGFDVLRLLGTEISLQECAAEMKVSTSTVFICRSRILEKLNLFSTAERIRFALENKISG